MIAGRVGACTVHLRAWSRQTFSRDQLVNSFKTLLWVVPLTVLIWIYAEREQLDVESNVTVPIEVTSSDPNRVVTLERPADPLLLVTLSGPRSQVEAAIHGLNPSYGGHPVTIEIDRNLDPGLHQIDSTRIGTDPRFAGNGVSVSGCQPPAMDVLVDPIVELQIPVEVNPIEREKLIGVGAVTFKPPVVTVRGPRSVLDKAKENSQLKVYADLANRPELTDAGATSGDQAINLSDVKLSLSVVNRNISIVGSGIVQAEASPTTGKPLVLSVVPVEVVATNDVLDHYRVDFDNNKTLLNVKVVGPENQIDMLSRPEYSPRPKAMFEVTTDDVGGPKTVPVEFRLLPPGVHYSGPPATVTFQLVPRRGTE